MSAQSLSQAVARWNERNQPQRKDITLYPTYNGLYRYQDNRTGMQYTSSDVFALVADGWTIRYID